MSTVSGSKTGSFKPFPEFSKLTLADKQAYEAAAASFPPMYDVSFMGLMSWWNPLNQMAVARLNDNLVLPYWFPGDERHSGLSLLGTNKVDESICAIFDYLRAKGEKPQLMNVPEFVVSHVRYPEMFTFKEEKRYNECVLPIARFYPLKNMVDHRRRKVERQLKRMEGRSIVVRSLDLGLRENRQLLLKAAGYWGERNVNHYGKAEREAMKVCMDQADILDVDNACLFIDDELHGFCLYNTPLDRRYTIVRHIKATHKDMLGFELIAYEFAKWFARQGVSYANITADYGLLRLRMFMLTLGPSNFFRKYRITPV